MPFRTSLICSLAKMTFSLLTFFSVDLFLGFPLVIKICRFLVSKYLCPHDQNDFLMPCCTFEYWLEHDDLILTLELSMF